LGNLPTWSEEHLGKTGTIIAATALGAVTGGIGLIPSFGAGGIVTGTSLAISLSATGATYGFIAGNVIAGMASRNLSAAGGGSSTYEGDGPQLTISENLPISRYYGRGLVAGNIVRSNDPSEADIRYIVAHCSGEIDSLLAYRLNGIDWDDIEGTNYKAYQVGDFTQTGIQVNGGNLFDLQNIGYRGVTHSGFILAKNNQIGSLPATIAYGRFLLCSPIAISLVNSDYKWTESVAQAGEFHCEAAGGGDPGLTEAETLQIDGRDAEEGTVGSLVGHEWDWGNNDTLGYNTVYVRLVDSSNPDDQDDDFIMTETAKIWSRDPAIVLWDFYRNVESYPMKELNEGYFNSLSTHTCVYPTTGPGAPTRPPGPSSTTVKATSYISSYDPQYAFDVNKSITGTNLKNQWSSDGVTTNQRLNIDMGVPVVPTKLVIVNGHTDGASTDVGIKEFILQGSNTVSDFNATPYATAGSWVEIETFTTAKGNAATAYSSANPEEDLDVASPPGTAYRYYSLKIANNHGNGSNMQLRDCVIWGRNPRYTFDYNFDTGININDAKKLIWSSFNGTVIRSQGKLKPVFEWAEEADGSGGVTGKSSEHTFDLDNIIQGSFSYKEINNPNVVSIEYLDSNENYKKGSITVRDDGDIEDRGEVRYAEVCLYISSSDVARRKAKFILDKGKVLDYVCELTGDDSSADLEVMDMVQVTHFKPGWTNKQFLIMSKKEDAWGRSVFTLEAYLPTLYGDYEAAAQESFFSSFANPLTPPLVSELSSISISEVSSDSKGYFPSVNLTFTPPTTNPHYSHVEVFVSTDDATYIYYGTNDSGTGFIIDQRGVKVKLTDGK